MLEPNQSVLSCENGMREELTCDQLMRDRLVGDDLEIRWSLVARRRRRRLRRG
jgi:hypothetical protein